MRAVSLDGGKVLLDEPAEAGLGLRAISDSGILVESGLSGAMVVDVTHAVRRPRELDVGYRAFFRSGSELVFLRGARVGVVDLARD